MKVTFFFMRTSSLRSAVQEQSLTASQRWRLRRNLVIYAASKWGISQRMLADVFDLPQSCIHDILKGFSGVQKQETKDH